MKWCMVLAMLFIWPLSIQSVQAWERDKTYKITILHTNDHHGHFWHNKYGEYGLAARKTLVDSIRKEVTKEGGHLLLLSAGDINTGVPSSDLQHAEPDFMGMNLAGYDVMAVGNHEFDNPLSLLRKQEKWAKFPFLSANVYRKSTGKRLFRPWVIFKRSGIKIAVIGLTTPDTPKLANPKHFIDIEFRDPEQEIKHVLAGLKKHEKPDVILALTHMGYYKNGQYGTNAPGDVHMACALPKASLTMIIGGHSHSAVCMGETDKGEKAYIPGMPCIPDKKNGIWIAQAHEWGKYVGRADFEFRNGVMRLTRYQLIPINLKKKITDKDGKSKRVFYTHEIAEDPEMLALLRPYYNKSDAYLKVKIGTVKGRFDGERNKVRFMQTNLGHLVLSAQLERTKADFAVMSGGGLRTSIEEGDVSYRDVLKVQPFGSTIVYVDMTGKEVKEYLTKVAYMKKNSGAYPQFFNVGFIAEKAGLNHITIKGKPLKENKIYRLATLSFNASGGDKYPPIDKHLSYVNTGFIDAEVLKKYIHQHSPLNAQDYQPKGEVVWK